MDEVYRLRRTKNGWKVFENRAWPVAIRLRFTVTLFDAKKWKELDASVEGLKGDGNQRALAKALFDAYRFDEAHDIARKYTTDGRQNAADWAWRGQVAVVAGDAEDAKAAFDKALSLDPKAPVPYYARVKE